MVPCPEIDREWAWGGSDGAGVRVAIVDSGVERDHPDVGGRLVRSVKVELVGDDEPTVLDDPEGIDVVGHGTACAGIIHALAPGAEFLSVRVLGPQNRGKGIVFAEGLAWAIENGASVVNLSLSSKSDALFGTFHELADEAYFANVLLVSAANNVPGASYPSLFSSVVSVAAHDLATRGRTSTTHRRRWSSARTAWTCGSPGTAAGGWSSRGTALRRRTSPGIAALIRAKHPEATPFEVKTILAATATGAR